MNTEFNIVKNNTRRLLVQAWLTALVPLKFILKVVLLSLKREQEAQSQGTQKYR